MTRIITQEYRTRMSILMRSKMTREVRAKISTSMSGEKAHNWKGNKVGYQALHVWVRKTLGEPRVCGVCSTQTAKKYEWANISREYLRKVDDWQRMCTSCHHKFDESRKKAWETRRLKETPVK